MGWRLDGVVRDVGWGDYSRAVAADWTEEKRELHQVQKELWAVHRVLTVDGEAMRGRSLVVWTDCRGVVRYLRVGMGGSDVLTRMAKQIFWVCVRLGASQPRSRCVPSALRPASRDVSCMTCRA